MLKGNVSTMVGQLYKQGDPRRDSGFSLFYMGINLGALISPLACGWVGQRISWRLGFGLAGLGMILGLIQYVLGGKYLAAASLHPATTGDPAKDRAQKRNTAWGGLVLLGVFAVFAALGARGVVTITPELIFNGEGILLLAVSILVFAWLIFGKGWSPEERKRSMAVLVLFVASVTFWAAFEQAGSTLNLFADRSTNCAIFGFSFPSSWFQTVQPVLVVIFAPVFAWLWLALGKRDPSSPAKFSLGLLCNGAGFVLLVPAAWMVAGGGKAGPLWLTGTYFLQTLGELCLSPVGLSATSKLAPARAAGFMMGIWFLSTAIGNWLAGKAATLYSTMPVPTLFGYNAAFSLGAAVLMVLMIKPTVRLMSGVK
jgi:POT family proton-dependent oligopeptide transporter